MKFTVKLNASTNLATPATAVRGKLYRIVKWPSGDYEGLVVVVFEDCWTRERTLICVNDFSKYWTIKTLTNAGDHDKFGLKELEKDESITLSND